VHKDCEAKSVLGANQCGGLCALHAYLRPSNALNVPSTKTHCTKILQHFP